MRATLRLTLLVALGGLAAACSGAQGSPARSAPRATAAALGAGSDRSGHVAVLLPDGTVLVAGGKVGGGAVLTADIVDPSTGLVTSTGPLGHPHVDGAAVVLEDGRVLVIGGEDGSGAPTTASEVYDPAGGAFSDVGPLQVARTAFTANRLPDGTVVAVGGRGAGAALDSVEIFDPSAGEGGAWTLGADTLGAARSHHTTTLLGSGELVVIGGESGGAAVTSPVAERLTAVGAGFTAATGGTARTHHTATLLGTGDVLVVGGTDGAALQSAELYRPASHDFAATAGQPGVARADHTSTLLPEGTVVVAGGQDAGAAVTTVEVYRPSTDDFTAPAQTQANRVRHVATLLPSGRVLLTGGGSATPELLDQATDVWTALALNSSNPIPVPRHGHTATLLVSGANAGRVLVVGGVDPYGAYLNSSQLFDPASGQLLNATIPAMANARAYHTATVLPDGKVLVTGGSTGTLTTDAAQVYDPAANSWSGVIHMAQRRAAHTATALPGGQVLVAGGEDGGVAVASAELFDPGTQAFLATAGGMTTARSHHAASQLRDGTVLLTGGADGTPGSTVHASAEVFDPATGMFTAVGAMGAARADHTATPLASGDVLVVGGVDASATALGTAELYHPSSRSFAAVSGTGSTIPARQNHAASVLPGGAVLVAGGSDSGADVQDAHQYEPALGHFTAADPLNHPHSTYTATVLPSGAVLAWGGVGTDRLSLGEVYSGFASSGRPTPDLSGALPRRVPGGDLPLTAATSFLGDSEAASGDARSSAANHPVVQLERQGGDGLAFARVTRFAAGSATALLPADLLPGWWWARVIVAGVPGKALPFFVLPPFHISPDPASTPPRGSIQFSATGGSNSGYAWSVSPNASGATIDAATGLYTAGATGSVTDVVRVTDSDGNVATVNVTVGPGVSIAPADPLIPPRGSVAFTASGGSGAGYTWSITTNNSGGTVGANGDYQAGAVSGVVDTVQVLDSLGNVATTTVTVTAPLTAAPVGPLTVFPGQSVHFTTAGGSGVGVTWTLPTNGSGASVVPVAGSAPAEADYTAGRTGNADDVLHVQDSVGNSVDVAIHVLPGITIDPASATTPPRGAQAFSATGGSGTGYVWEVLQNRSGATIDAAGGYTAGSTPSVVDVIRVTDDLGNVATANVTVGPGITISPPRPGAYPGQTVALTATGGSGTGWVWSMVTVNSNGGTIDASGVYTAGTTRGALDVVKVVDSLGNEATVDVAVWPDWQAKGSGCGSSGGGTGAAGLLALALLLALRVRPWFRRALAGAAVAALALTGLARAQTPPVSTSFMVERFQPEGGAFDVLGVESAQVAGHLATSIQLWGNYGHRPLIVTAPGVNDAALLKSQTALDLALSLGLWDWAELSVVVPAVVSQSREENRLLPPDLSQSIAKSGIEDVRIVPKVRLVDWKALRLGLAVPVTLPTGSTSSYLGHGSVTVNPRALVELDGLGPVRVLLNGGAIFREDRQLIALTVGNAYTYGAGLEWALGQRFSALGTFQGESGMKGSSGAARPMEALAGLRWQGPSGLHATIGGGPGIGDGYGTPQYRVFAEIGYTTADSHRLERKEPPPKAEPEPVVAKKEEPKPEPAKEEPKPEPKPEPVPPPVVAEKDQEEVPPPEVVNGELRIDAKVYFAFNKKEIKPQFEPMLEQIAQRIVSEPRMKVVRIEGHADDLGPPEYNVWLSLERAKAVQAFLVKHGVPAKRVVIVGYGKMHPAEQGKSKAARSKNRRVEFNVQEH